MLDTCKTWTQMQDSNSDPPGIKEVLTTTPNKFFYYNMIFIILIIINVGHLKHAWVAADANWIFFKKKLNS